MIIGCTVNDMGFMVNVLVGTGTTWLQLASVAVMAGGFDAVRLIPRLRTAIGAARASDRRGAPSRLAVADPPVLWRVRHIADRYRVGPSLYTHVWRRFFEKCPRREGRR